MNNEILTLENKKNKNSFYLFSGILFALFGLLSIVNMLVTPLPLQSVYDSLLPYFPPEQIPVMISVVSAISKLISAIISAIFVFVPLLAFGIIIAFAKNRLPSLIATCIYILVYAVILLLAPLSILTSFSLPLTQAIFTILGYCMVFLGYLAGILTLVLLFLMLLSLIKKNPTGAKKFVTLSKITSIAVAAIPIVASVYSQIINAVFYKTDILSILINLAFTAFSVLVYGAAFFTFTMALERSANDMISES